MRWRGLGGSTVAMTLTNHTEYLSGANAGGGQFINADVSTGYPHAKPATTSGDRSEGPIAKRHNRKTGSEHLSGLSAFAA
ncbi:MAG: hypothetical protein QM658_13760 [Gordonia sp. (in: high G+C Gram-positive bacteria)]